MAYAAQAIEDLLADPAELIASTDADLSTCRAEAEDLLGKAWDPAGATLPWETGEVVVWFVSGDGGHRAEPGRVRPRRLRPARLSPLRAFRLPGD